jgi:hypothetical protein
MMTLSVLVDAPRGTVFGVWIIDLPATISAASI